MKMNKKGFTLAELLVVVAIIAVLVAISIPVFTAQLEKAKEATDEANIRSIYAQLSSDVITGSLTNSNAVCPIASSYIVEKASGVVTGTAQYKMTQGKTGLESGNDITIGGVTKSASAITTGTCTIVLKDDGTTPSITFN